MPWNKLASLRTRLMCLVLLALAPAVALVVIESGERRDELQARFQDEARNLAALSASSGKELFASAANLLEVLAGLSEFRTSNGAACQAILPELLDAFPWLAGIGVASPEGGVLCADGLDAKALDLAGQNWFKNARATGAQSLGAYPAGRISNKPVAVVAKPAHADSPDRAPVMFLALNLDWFHTLLDAISLPEAATVSVVDRAGVVLTRRPGTGEPAGKTILEAGRVLSSERLGALVTGQETGLDGQRRLYAYAPISGVPGSEIYVRVGLSLSRAEEKARGVMWRDLGLLGAVAALILAATHLFGEALILRPAKKLVAAAQGLASGDYDIAGLSGGRGELAELGRAFELMAATVKEKVRFTQALIDSIPTPVFYKDLEGRYIGCNRQYETDVRPRQTLIGRTSFGVFDLRPAAAYDRQDRELLEGGGTQAFDDTMVFRDGRTHDVVITKAAYRDAMGNPAGIVGVLMDITERKSLEMRLTRAKEAAEAANMVKTRFLASVSHEIRTPMNSIMGLTELALNGELAPQLRDHLETVDASAKALLELIDDILDFAKIEAGELRLVELDFSPQRLLAEVVRPLRVQAAAKGIGLSLRIDPSLPVCLKGDPARLRQIMVNLVGNAVKFTARGEVEVAAKASVGGEDVPGLHAVTLSVADTGIGIAPDKLGEIFEPFRQADGTVGRRYGGTGLGLAISRELSELMGASIKAESVAGQGSVFTFTGCFKSGDQSRAAYAEPLMEAGQDTPGRPLHILVVDDNEINLKVCRALLGRLGHDTQAAGSGQEAIARLRREDFDAVLLDLEMPGQDGLEVAHGIRAGEAGETAKAVPIIAVTAHALAGYREMSLAAGMNGFITKPVSLASLASTLQALAGGLALTQAGQTGDLNCGCQAEADLDRDEALSQLGGDSELLDEITKRLREELPAKMRLIEEGLSAPDAEGVRRGAHALAGICGAIGAKAAMAAAKRLEAAAALDPPPDLAPLGGELLSALNRLALLIA